MDLYAALGVARDATAGQIKKVFRGLAKTYHPDAGGDPEKFHAIALAYEVLKDDEKRAHYDETGEVPGARENPDAVALNIINGLVDGLTNDIVHKEGLEHDDLVALMVKNIDRQIGDMLANRKEAEKFEKKAVKIRARFKAKTGPDFIGRMLDERIAAARKAVAQAAEQLGHLERARKMLGDAVFEVEPRPASQRFDPLANAPAGSQYMYPRSFFRDFT